MLFYQYHPRGVIQKIWIIRIELELFLTLIHDSAPHFDRDFQGERRLRPENSLESSPAPKSVMLALVCSVWLLEREEVSKGLVS